MALTSGAGSSCLFFRHAFWRLNDSGFGTGLSMLGFMGAGREASGPRVRFDRFNIYTCFDRIGRTGAAVGPLGVSDCGWDGFRAGSSGLLNLRGGERATVVFDFFRLALSLSVMDARASSSDSDELDATRLASSQAYVPSFLAFSSLINVSCVPTEASLSEPSALCSRVD
jgi:hypothetical protein